METKHLCQSGGAIGADTAFGEAAYKAGHYTVHYAFNNMNTKCKENEKTKILRLELSDLLEGDKALREAQKTLIGNDGKKRRYPTSSVYVNNLLRRNYHQIKRTNAVYAVSRLTLDKRHVEGGTGWAIEMAIHKRILSIFVFDTNGSQWYIYSYDLSQFVPEYSVPRPDGIYTGIGSRELPENGKQAIDNLYRIGKNATPKSAEASTGV